MSQGSRPARRPACPESLNNASLRCPQAGGFVRDNRINGALNVSRTIGDLDFKRNADLPHTEQMVGPTAPPLLWLPGPAACS